MDELCHHRARKMFLCACAFSHGCMHFHIPDACLSPCSCTSNVLFSFGLRSILANVVLTQQPRARFLNEISGAKHRSSFSRLIFSTHSSVRSVRRTAFFCCALTHIEDARLRSRSDERRPFHAMHVPASSVRRTPARRPELTST